MAFRRSDLQEAFFVPGAYAFRVLGYGTADPLEAVLAAGYFGAAGALLQPGDLVYVRARAADGDVPGAGAAAVRMALLMVRAGARGRVGVRLVQDFGRTDAPDPAEPTAAARPVSVAATAPTPKRGRGRPPGSRNKKNGALAATALN